MTYEEGVAAANAAGFRVNNTIQLSGSDQWRVNLTDDNGGYGFIEGATPGEAMAKAVVWAEGERKNLASQAKPKKVEADDIFN